MVLGTRDGRGRDRGVSYLDFMDWRDSIADVLRDWRVLAASTMNISDEGRPPERFLGRLRVRPHAFGLIGEQPRSAGLSFLTTTGRALPAVVHAGKQRVAEPLRQAILGVVGGTIRVNELPSVGLASCRVASSSPSAPTCGNRSSTRPARRKQKRDARTPRSSAVWLMASRLSRRRPK